MAAAALACISCASCESEQPAAATNEVLSAEDARTRKVLTDAERASAVEAFRDLAAGHQPSQVPRPAPGPAGVRWSDVPAAMDAAVDEEGVEMAVVRTIPADDEYTFILRTIEDWPAEMIVRRVHDDRVYEVESVQVGRFPQMPERVERAQRLVAAFRDQMQRLGRLRKFPD